MAIYPYPCDKLDRVACGPCPTCDELYDWISDETFGLRLIFYPISPLAVGESATISYHLPSTPGTSVSIAMTTLNSGRKLCVFRGSGEDAVELPGPMWYTLSVPRDAILEQFIYVDSTGTPQTRPVDTCTFGNEIVPQRSVVPSCIRTTDVAEATSCGTTPTGGTPTTIYTAIPTCPSPQVCSGTWVAVAESRGEASPPACAYVVNNTNADKTGGERSSYRTDVSATVYEWSDRRFDIPFSVTIINSRGTASVAGRVWKTGNSTVGITVESVALHANEPPAPGSGSAVSCTGASACEPAVNETVNALALDVPFACSSLRLQVNVRVTFSYRHLGGGTTECCLCTAPTRVKGATHTVNLTQINAALV